MRGNTPPPHLPGSARDKSAQKIGLERLRPGFLTPGGRGGRIENSYKIKLK